MQYTHELNKAYADIERNLMKRVHTSNLRNFRIALLGTIVGITWIGAVFGGQVAQRQPLLSYLILIPHKMNYYLTYSSYYMYLAFNGRILDE